MITPIIVGLLLVVIFFTAMLTPDAPPRCALPRYKRDYRFALRLNRTILIVCVMALAAIAVF